MRILVAAVGRSRAAKGGAPEQILFDDYAKRLVARGPAGMTLDLREVEEGHKARCWLYFGPEKVFDLDG